MLNVYVPFSFPSERNPLKHRLIRLEQIIGDSQTLEKEAIAAEQEAQSTYETFVQEPTDMKFVVSSCRRELSGGH